MISSRARLAKRLPGAGNVVRSAHGRLTRALRNALAPHGIGIGEFQLLRALYVADGQSQKELSDKIEVEKAALTKLFQSMEEDGLIVRRPDADDARKRNVFLTPRAEALCEATLEISSAVNRVASRGIPREDIATMMRVLNQMVENLDTLE